MPLDDVLLDPSLLVSDKELAATESRVERHFAEDKPQQEFQFHVPSAFLDALNTSETIEDTAIYNFYSIGDVPAEPDRIQAFLNEYDEQIQPYRPDTYYVDTTEGEARPVSGRLRDELSYYGRFKRTDQLTTVLAQEFVFMNEESIIIAEIDRQVQKFKEIGSVVLDVSRTAFDTIVRRALDIDEDDLDEGEEILNRANILRTFGKFAIIGGSSVTGAVGGPLIAALGSAAGGIILLIDPESQEDI